MKVRWTTVWKTLLLTGIYLCGSAAGRWSPYHGRGNSESNGNGFGHAKPQGNWVRNSGSQGNWPGNGALHDNSYEHGGSQGNLGGNSGERGNSDYGQGGSHGNWVDSSGEQWNYGTQALGVKGIGTVDKKGNWKINVGSERNWAGPDSPSKRTESSWDVFGATNSKVDGTAGTQSSWSINGVSQGNGYGTQDGWHGNGNYDDASQGVPGGDSAGSWHHAEKGTWQAAGGSQGTWGHNNVVTRDSHTAQDGTEVLTERNYFTGSSRGRVVSNGDNDLNSMRVYWVQRIKDLMLNGFSGFTDPWKTSMDRSGVHIRKDNGEATSENHEKEETHDFDYDRRSFYGPENWSFFWAQCTGSRQSPINVEDSRLTYTPFAIRFCNIPVYGFRGKFFNNGHAPTFALLVDGSVVRGVPTTPRDTYKLIQFHFHFACDAEGGSEHTINGHRKDAEMHMVHYNTKYANFDEAMDKQDGLAVIAVFVQATEKSKGTFDKFIKANEEYLLDVSETGKETLFNPFLLVPVNKEAYVYRGSLTTPGCLESVSWVIFRTPVAINQNTMRVFREMHDGHGDEMITVNGNCRPLQPLGTRTLMANFHP